jgi:hypothetical protein
VNEIPQIQPQAGSRLDDLCALYAELKPRADELTARLKVVTDAIKAELTAAAPGAQRIGLSHEALPAPLRLAYIESWSLDSKRLKADDPALYVRYARKTGKWELRGQKA